MTPLLIDTTLTLFEGQTYTQFDTETGQPQVATPRPIKSGWPIPFVTIDAALNWGDGTVYFVQGMQLVRYNLERATVEPGYPKILPFYWRGLWASDLNAAFRTDDLAFFFKKTECIQYDIRAGHADLSGPLPTADTWHGLPKHLTGAVPITETYLLFFSNQLVYVYDLTTDHTVAGPVPFADFIRDGIPAFLSALPHPPN